MLDNILVYKSYVIEFTTVDGGYEKEVVVGDIYYKGVFIESLHSNFTSSCVSSCVSFVDDCVVEKCL